MALSRRLLSTRKRLELLQAELDATKGVLRVRGGLRVLHIAECGHEECGDSMPTELPADCWVVLRECKLEEPDQVSQRSLDEEREEVGKEMWTKQQQEAYDALMSMGRSNEKGSDNYGRTLKLR